MVTFSGQFYMKHSSVIKVINRTDYIAAKCVRAKLYIAVYYLKKTRIWDYNNLYHGAKVRMVLEFHDNNFFAEFVAASYPHLEKGYRNSTHGELLLQIVSFLLFFPL